MLIEQGELDRLQQRQISDYLPELHNMAVLRKQIAEVLTTKGMSADAKLSLLSTYQTLFDKLHKDIGMLSTGTLTNAASGPAVKKVNTDISLNKTNASADDKDTSAQTDTSETDVERESETEIQFDEKSSPMSVQQFGILRQYQQKSSKLFYEITQNPDVLTRNDAGDMVVFGRAQPGTDFDNLFKSMVGRTRDLKQPGN